MAQFREEFLWHASGYQGAEASWQTRFPRSARGK
jgi:hypothetical protein